MKEVSHDEFLPNHLSEDYLAEALRAMQAGKRGFMCVHGLRPSVGTGHGESLNVPVAHLSL